MRKQILTAIASATLLLSLAPASMAQNLAIVNGKAVPKARVEMLIQQSARAGRQMNPEQAKEAVIVREIFMQEAQARGLDSTDDFKAQLELTRQSILINELFADFQKKNPITDAEILAKYDEFVAANSGKEYRARHILVETEKEAKDIIAQLKKGGKFDVIAKKSSKDPGSGANGGDLNWSPAGGFVKEFSEALQALAKGKTTEAPVKTEFGYHIIRLDDVREAQLPKLEEVKPQIGQQLAQDKMNKFQGDMRAKAKVE